MDHPRQPRGQLFAAHQLRPLRGHRGRERFRSAAGRKADLRRRAGRGIVRRRPRSTLKRLRERVAPKSLAALTLVASASRASAVATNSPSRCLPATTSPTMPAPASCTPRRAMAARTLTPGWMPRRNCAARGIDTAHPLHRRRRRLLHQGRAGLRAGSRGRGGARHRRQRQEGQRQQGRHRRADRAQHAVRARPAEAQLSASLALEEAGDLPQHAAMVRPHGQGAAATARRCAPARSPPSTPRASCRPPARRACAR